MTVVAKVSSKGSGIAPDISQYVGNADSKWGDVEFHINTELASADVWFVIEDVDVAETCDVPPGRVVFLSAETSWEADRYIGNSPGKRFLQQFDRVFTPHAAYFPDAVQPLVQPSMPFLPWMINANHGNAINQPHRRDLTWLQTASRPPKTAEISVICSTQSRTPTHRMRLAFVQALKSHFGDRLDWYGNGVNPIPEKWDALAPYRYSIALENSQAPHLITEKLLDCFLTWTHPIYWGAPNVSDYFPEGSYTSINIRDLGQSIEVIERALASTELSGGNDVLEQARNLALTSLNPYERMAQIAGDLMTCVGKPQEVTVRPMAAFEGEQSSKPRLHRIGEAFNKVGDVLVRRSMSE
jgi:hypothetical protein